MSSLRQPDRDEVVASRLGELAQGLDGQVETSVHVASRRRLLHSLGRSSGSMRAARVRWAAVAALVLLSAAGAYRLSIGRQPQLAYQLSGSAMQVEDDWVHVAPARGPGLLLFSEGTAVTLAAGSRTRVTELSADGARVELREGTLRAKVAHRARTRWSFAAGPYSVQVTGTELDVAWDPARAALDVRLTEGSVIVRGPGLNDGIVVRAGQTLKAHADSARVELASSEPSQVAPVAADSDQRSQPTNDRSPGPAPAGLSRVSWSDLMARGSFRAVVTQAQARGIETVLRRASLSDLVALSDAARYVGDRDLARRGLLAQRERFGATTQAQAAAFLLGRMADDDGSTAEALRWYDVYLRQAPAGALAAEAAGWRLVALVRSGDQAAAHTAAQQYLQRFARGAHAGYAAEVLQRK